MQVDIRRSGRSGMDAESDGLAGRMGDILLVEDEAWARESGAYFEGLGFRVRTAARASEALRQARARLPDVLVVDIRLAGRRTGIDVALDLRRQRPDLPVIVQTGLSDVDLEPYRDHLAGLLVLRKPIRLLELAEIIIGSMFDDRSRRAS